MKQNIYDNQIFYQKYSALRESGVTYNDFIEQPAMKSAISSLQGKIILDLGCGAGKFARYCIDNGAARVCAVDISRNMIEQAKKENEHENIDYICMPMEELELTAQTFDLVISSLAIHYMEDFDNLIAKVYRLLNRNGEFIFSTEHPVTTARKEKNNWVKDKDGNKLHWALDNYQEEGKRKQHWYIDGVITYHRTISTLINTLIKNGFILEKVMEPQSTPEGLKKMPKLVNEKRRPSFIIIKSRKAGDDFVI